MHTPSAIRVVRIALRLSLAAAFCPLLPTDSAGGSRLGRVAGGAWVPSPTYPPACSVCFWMVIDRHCVGCHRHRSDPGSLAPDRLAAKTRWRGNLLGAHNIWNRDGCIPRYGITA